MFRMFKRPRHPLADLPLLAGVPAAQVAQLASLMTFVQVPAGQVLVTEGARNRQFVLLEQGSALVSRDGGRIAELGAGDVVGELSLLGDGTANATVTTSTDVRAYVSTSREFEALLHSALGDRIQGAAALRRVA